MTDVRSDSMVADEIAITDLILEYAACVDRGDFSRVGALFTQGVLLSPRGAARGADEVTEWYRAVKLDERGSPGTWHHVFGVEVAIVGDSASARSYITVIQGGRPIVAATYDDTFLRADGTWRFATRHISMDLIGDLRDHLDIAQSRHGKESR